jgi:succinoglycan biosynthesis protein ExoM
VAIPTFRRAAYLPGLIAALARLKLPAGVETIRVVIMDNDPEGSARPWVAALRSGFPFRLHYEHVPEPGLSTVRNAILAYAQRHADVLAMLDDDELPEPQWLFELLRVAEATGADAVAGPVPALLPHDAPRWLRQFREREYPSFADGALLTDGWSSNCLLRVPAIAAAGLAFDPALNFSGGEDQLFFRQLLASGGTIAFAARATAWEILPPERRSARFVLMRSFRRGNSLAVCDRRLHGHPGGLALRAAKALAAIATGIASCRAPEVARGAGMLAGLAGVFYQAYRRHA